MTVPRFSRAGAAASGICVRPEKAALARSAGRWETPAQAMGLQSGHAPRSRAGAGRPVGAAPGASTAAARVDNSRPIHSASPRTPDALDVQLQRAVLQRVFQHKGRKQKAATFGKGSTPPNIQGAKTADLQKLADDDHDYGAIEKKSDVDAALLVYATNHPVVVVKTPLDEAQLGNVTVLDVPAFSRNTRVTFQVDWLQGKHDQPFMRAESDVAPRGMDGTQMRRSLEQYADLARGVPTALARQHMARILAKGEEVAHDFSIMGTKQSDGLYYEISGKWQSLGGNNRHVLIYYHCFPPEKDEAKWS